MTMDIEKLDEELENKEPQEILKRAIELFDRIAISFSGAEDVVLIDMASKIKEGIEVFTLDTGRLHPETYDFIDIVRDRYPVELKVYFPDHRAVESLVDKKGLFSFYADGHEECCGIRKVEPLERALRDIDCWVTGQRKDSNVTRRDLPVVQRDPAHEGKVKFNPLANWSLKQVWDYIHRENVPYNKLHERGFVSIGCAPCTRAITPGEHERAGRWWWEDATKRECGIHLRK